MTVYYDCYARPDRASSTIGSATIKEILGSHYRSPKNDIIKTNSRPRMTLIEIVILARKREDLGRFKKQNSVYNLRRQRRGDVNAVSYSKLTCA